MIAQVPRGWRAKWHARNLAWGWAHALLCVLAVYGMARMLWPAGAWRGVLFLAFVPLEVLVAFSSGVARSNHSGSLIHTPETEYLKKQLRARADIRVSDDAKLFGGACSQRWGRDVVVVAVGDFEKREMLAVIAHELGHTKQSVLAKVLAPGVTRLGLVAMWLWGLDGDWLLQGVGVTTGAILWVWLLYCPSQRVRWVSLTVAWAAWWWWLTGREILPVCVGLVLWLVWQVIAAMWSRVSELLADEAVMAVDNGHAALSSALSRVAGRPVAWWRRPFLSHPEPHRRGLGRSTGRGLLG